MHIELPEGMSETIYLKLTSIRVLSGKELRKGRLTETVGGKHTLTLTLSRVPAVKKASVKFAHRHSSPNIFPKLGSTFLASPQ